jgi:hypothetical protein
MRRPYTCSEADAGRLSVWQRRVQDSAVSTQQQQGDLLWQAVGWRDPIVGASQGWHRVRVSVPGGSWPIVLVIVADRLRTATQYVGVDEIMLVNDQNLEIGCGKQFLCLSMICLFLAYDFLSRMGGRQGDNSFASQPRFGDDQQSTVSAPMSPAAERSAGCAHAHCVRRRRQCAHGEPAR